VATSEGALQEFGSALVSMFALIAVVDAIVLALPSISLLDRHV
jgi:hypothetical protein